MSGPTPQLPEERKPISGAYLSLIAISFSELRKDASHLIDSGWAEPVRRRADELATTLARACARQGLHDLAKVARVLANLTQLSRANALPIQAALAEKIDALMREASKLLAEQSKKGLG